MLVFTTADLTCVEKGTFREEAMTMYPLSAVSSFLCVECEDTLFSEPAIHRSTSETQVL